MTMNMVAVFVPDFNALNSCRFMNVDLKKIASTKLVAKLESEVRLGLLRIFEKVNETIRCLLGNVVAIAFADKKTNTLFVWIGCLSKL